MVGGIFELGEILEQMIGVIDEHKDYERSFIDLEAFENLQTKIWIIQLGSRRQERDTVNLLMLKDSGANINR